MTSREEWQHRLVVAVSEAEAALYRAQMATRKLRELRDPPAPEIPSWPSETRSGPVLLGFLGNEEEILRRYSEVSGFAEDAHPYGDQGDTIDEAIQYIDGVRLRPANPVAVISRCPVHLEPIGDGRACIACDGGVF